MTVSTGPRLGLARPQAPTLATVKAVAKRAIGRKTGARGLRSIMESILLDTMFDLPQMSGVEEVVINREVIEGRAKPLQIYAERRADGPPAA